MPHSTIIRLLLFLKNSYSNYSVLACIADKVVCNLLTRKYTLGFHVSGSFLRSDFGVDAYLPIVGDKILIDVYAEFN